MKKVDRRRQRIWSAALDHTITVPVIAVVMGVSGSGKTTVAVLLAAALGCQFQEGDDLHPAANVEKMRGGTPLTDADRSLLSRAPIPAMNVHAIPTEGLNPEAAASAYASELKSFYGTERLDSARPLFDVKLLGLGPDGHTASLFPGTAALTERDRWVTAVIGAKAEARITLTYPTLESSRHTAFLVAGKGKRVIFDRLRRGNDSLPATHLCPTGTLSIFADTAAVAVD